MSRGFERWPAQRPTSARKTSTSDLLTWLEAPPPGFSSSAVSDTANSRSTSRSYQPSDGMSKVLFGGEITEEEAESLNKRKPCYGYRLKEINGSKVFSADVEDNTLDSATSYFDSSNRTSVRMVQQVTNGISQISFSTQDDVSPRKPITLPEVAKQRELSGTLGDSDSNTTKHLSDAKSKELSGHDIFAPPPEVPPQRAARSLEPKVSKVVEEPPAPRNVHTSVKVSNPAGGQSTIMFGDDPVVKTIKKIHNQKFAELTGNDIFKGDVSPGAAERQLSMAKRREMDGSNIFADGKSAASTDYHCGVRKLPGGESSIALI